MDRRIQREGTGKEQPSDGVNARQAVQLRLKHNLKNICSVSTEVPELQDVPQPNR